MSRNSEAIIALCSHLCIGENVVPLEPREWSELAAKLMDIGLQPADLFDFSGNDFVEKLTVGKDYADRIQRLIDRSASLAFEISKYENMGITAITRADKAYPRNLKKALGNSCPPLFYCSGEMSILDKRCIGYVGSRNVSDDDVEFTKKTVEKTVLADFGIVSGGAKGIDTISEETALALGAAAVEFVSDSMLRKLRQSSVVKAVNNGKLLILSVAKPDAGFNVGIAMMRNRYIYAHSSGTVVVRSDYEKGGTWAGATENLKYNWCKELCWDKKTYRGNQALIEKGALPIDINWNVNIDELPPNNIQDEYKQLSLFDNNKMS